MFIAFDTCLKTLTEFATREFCQEIVFFKMERHYRFDPRCIGIKQPLQNKQVYHRI